MRRPKPSQTPNEVPEDAYEHGESTIEAGTFDESCTTSFYRQEKRLATKRVTDFTPTMNELPKPLRSSAVSSLAPSVIGPRDAFSPKTSVTNRSNIFGMLSSIYTPNQPGGGKGPMSKEPLTATNCLIPVSENEERALKAMQRRNEAAQQADEPKTKEAETMRASPRLRPLFPTFVIGGAKKDSNRLLSNG